MITVKRYTTIGSNILHIRYPGPNIVSMRNRIHGEDPNVLRSIEAKDEERKNLIKLAVLKLFHIEASQKQNLGGYSQSTKETKTQNEVLLTEKVHNYEVEINKMKQQFSTKEKLQESKMETLKDEITRLRRELKEEKSSQDVVPTSTLGKIQTLAYGIKSRNSFSTSPYLNKALFGDLPSSRGLNKGTNKLFNQIDSGILSPITRKVKAPKSQTKREYINFNSMKKRFQEQQNENTKSNSKKETSDAEDNIEEISAISRNGSSGKLFNDESSTLDEVIQSATPTRSKKGALKSSPSAERSTRANNTQSKNYESSELSNLEEDSFTSANASLELEPKSKKKKLKLWKTKASKVRQDSSFALVESTPRPKGLHLDDETLDSLKYYKDENFLGENAESTPKVSKKRQLNDTNDDIDLPSSKKRKKHVFKID